ncbi:MAG: hypothetical protein IJ784_08785 [Ruminiclostridium sp.]|nr:hypothetical protein [Ruminiclostridium sp.]
MNSVKRFKNLMSILMLYAANIIVHDKIVLPEQYIVNDPIKRITGRRLLKITTSERA